MRYAYCINGFEDFNANIDLACVAEQAGWDGFFLPDGLALEVPGYGPMPLFDPWVLMGAIATIAPATVRPPGGTARSGCGNRRPKKRSAQSYPKDANDPQGGRLRNQDSSQRASATSTSKGRVEKQLLGWSR